MVIAFIVPELAELHMNSQILASMTSDMGPRKFSTVLTAGSEQLFLAKDGYPIMEYRISHDDEKFALGGTGTELIGKLIDNFENLKHSVLLYDDTTLARQLEFRYSKIVLQRGERFVYVIPEDDVESPESIRKEMDSFGIDTSYYMSNDLLKFVRIEDPSRDPQGFTSGCLKIANSIALYQSKIPLRIIVNMRYQLNTKEEIDGHSEFENIVDSRFAGIHGSILCKHFIGNYKLETRCLDQKDNPFPRCQFDYQFQKRHIIRASE